MRRCGIDLNTLLICLQFEDMACTQQEEDMRHMQVPVFIRERCESHHAAIPSH